VGMIKVSKGNHKLGTDTLILNITSAAGCPSRALGLCRIPGKCYAMKAERMYPAVRPYRDEQTVLWAKYSAAELVKDLVEIINRTRKPIKYLRYSEAGDFRTQDDVDKMSKIAELLEPYGVRVYGYTARKDLDFSHTHSNMVVNGSGFMVHNMFTAVPQAATGDTQCPGNCRICDKCKQHNNLDIKVLYH